MSRESVSTEFDCRRISVFVHRFASDKVAFVHSSCLFGAESYSGQKERERVSGKDSNQRFVNTCLANSPSVYIYTCSYTHLITSWSITIKTTAPQNVTRNAKEYPSMPAQ